MKRVFKVGISLLLLTILAWTAFIFWPFFPPKLPDAKNEKSVDVVIIGGGTMGATLGAYLQELEPEWEMHMLERQDGVGKESSNGWNNAGTGHTGFAELNYTPEKPDGTVPVQRAIKTAEEFEVSRQFWAHQVLQGKLSEPRKFINPTAHMSFVWGDENVAFLKKRYDNLIKNPLFYGMEFSNSHDEIKKWVPLVGEGRDTAQKVAATRMELGTDVNYGEITRQLIASLNTNPKFNLHLEHEVNGLKQNDDKTWNVAYRNLKTGEETSIKTNFVFIGAGGAALKLLQLSDIPEAKNYAGFPVGGEFLVFDNPNITNQHAAKVYGQAETGAPPMSVPHLDTRILDGKKVVLFGPYALYSTKFLKYGSWFDLFSSITPHNNFGMWKVGIDNLPLVKYLVQQVMLTDEDRHAELLKYYPNAKPEDWKLWRAGQRVQIIKNDPEKGFILQFGTEIVSSEDKTISSLLGASPGASTAPQVMLRLLEIHFPDKVAGQWQEKIKQIVPSYGQKLNDDIALTNKIRKLTSSALELPFIEVPENLLDAPAADDKYVHPANDAPMQHSEPIDSHNNIEMQAV